MVERLDVAAATGEISGGMTGSYRCIRIYLSKQGNATAAVPVHARSGGRFEQLVDGLAHAGEIGKQRRPAGIADGLDEARLGFAPQGKRRLEDVATARRELEEADPAVVRIHGIRDPGRVPGGA